MSSAFRILRSVSLLATIFLAAWLLGRRAPAQGREAIAPPNEIGPAIDRLVVHGEGGDSHFLQSYIATDGLTGIVLFSTTCSTCAGEAAVWAELGADFREGFKLLAIATTPDVTFVRTFAGERGTNLTLLRGGSEVPKALGASGMPAIYVVDTRGRVLFHSVGSDATAALASWLRRNLAASR